MFFCPCCHWRQCWVPGELCVRWYKHNSDNSDNYDNDDNDDNDENNDNDDNDDKCDQGVAVLSPLRAVSDDTNTTSTSIQRQES